MSTSPPISRSKRQTSAAVVAAAALAVLALTCAAPAAQAAGARGTDADIPGMARVSSKVSNETGAHLLSRGAGYSSARGSPAVRGLQRMLRSLHQRPGPIDGLYGPLTQAAVKRFQQAEGLVADGIVGPRTGRSLARRIEAHRNPVRAETAKPPAVIGVPGAAATPAKGRAALTTAEQPADALPPEWAAVIAGLGLTLLLTALAAVRKADSRLNAGLAFACLLAVLVIGAAAGALFAGQASPNTPTNTPADALEEHAAR